MYNWIGGKQDTKFEYDKYIPVWIKYGYPNCFSIEIAYCRYVECEDGDFLAFYIFSSFGSYEISRNLVLEYAIIPKPDI